MFTARQGAIASPAPKHGFAQDLPSDYDQGQLGSCTANAIAAAIEFDRLKQGLKDFTPSRLFIYYNERVIEHTVQSDAGAAIRDGIKVSPNRVTAPKPNGLMTSRSRRQTDAGLLRRRHPL